MIQKKKDYYTAIATTIAPATATTAHCAARAGASPAAALSPKMDRFMMTAPLGAGVTGMGVKVTVDAGAGGSVAVWLDDPDCVEFLSLFEPPDVPVLVPVGLAVPVPVGVEASVFCCWLLVVASAAVVSCTSASTRSRKTATRDEEAEARIVS
ncbi:hypothetical protein BC828DRAFT_386769 [Blastocladiella britannica]|nr:hypothetical protein BC828DRAFT_386769 [Blastocladiella britannica]